MSTTLPTLEYCFVCSIKLTAITGRVLLRPLKASEARTLIPLNEQRFTMCAPHAHQAVAAGDYAIVNEDDQRITG